MSRVAITGALSYTGRYLSKHLLDAGLASSIVSLSRRSIPLSSHLLSSSDLEKISTRPLPFCDHNAMKEALLGVDILYCTYWIRFEMDGDTHEAAARRVGGLFEAAKEAGVKKIIFSSHTRTDVESPFSYIRGKALAEEKLRAVCEDGGMNYAIVRPCGIFGDTPSESILMNNASWVMRRTPLFLLAGDGSSVFQPVHVRDMAGLMASLGSESPHTTGEEKDACGPDAPSAQQLFSKLNEAVGGRGYVVGSRLPTWVLGGLTKPIDWFTGDILLDSDDLDLLESGLTRANDPSDPAIAQRRSLFEWIDEVKDDLGVDYISSVNRYYKQ